MNNKSLKSGVFYSLLRTLTLTFISFISFPFATSALGDIAMGEYTFANTFVYFFLIIAKLGIPAVAVRECAKVADDKEALNNKVQTFFVLQLITTLISYGLMLFFVFSLHGTLITSLSRELIFLLSLNFLVGVFSFEWVYIALEKHFYMAFRSILSATLTTILVILFVKNSNNLFTYAFFAMLTTFITVGFNMYNLHKEGISFKVKSKLDLLNNLKPLFIVFIIALLVTIYNQSDSLLLGFLSDDKSSVGSYAVGIRIIEIVITIITSLSAVFIPRTTIAYKNNDEKEFKNIISYSTNITLFIALPSVVALISLAPTFVDFSISDQKYWSDAAIQNSVIAISLLATMILTYSISDNIYQQILLPIKKEKKYFFVLISAVILDLALALLFHLVIIKNNVLLSVALATILTDIFVFLVMIIIGRKWIKHALFNLNSLKILLVSLLTGALMFFTKDFINIENATLKILTIIGYSGLFYVSLLILLKEKLTYSIIKRN